MQCTAALVAQYFDVSMSSVHTMSESYFCSSLLHRDGSLGAPVPVEAVTMGEVLSCTTGSGQHGRWEDGVLSGVSTCTG